MRLVRTTSIWMYCQAQPGLGGRRGFVHQLPAARAHSFVDIIPSDFIVYRTVIVSCLIQACMTIRKSTLLGDQIVFIVNWVEKELVRTDLCSYVHMQ